ncbi:DUF2330 domain-containing protein [Nocardia crassostreae]|uniref:DUF2330 domain-containing protein n=1 Tax=Nocardia crassostreae TaxID=53428 RepID=UPI000A062B42|nr:DUF2330 domain-containing protein [Nocardia crassostreae]
MVAPAAACACGGVATPAGESMRVFDETALVSWDGATETILMRLGFDSASENAALLVPTPAPATVTAGHESTFTALGELTEPRVVTDLDWFGDLSVLAGIGGMALFQSSGDGDNLAPGAVETSGSGAPEVVSRVQLGPLEAATLTGGDLTGIQKWLDDNGYAMRPEVTATMQPYLSEGWSFVAMRLSSGEPLRGAPDPVRLTFAADSLVYPMRMSGAATSAQTVKLYVLGPHRVQRSDPNATRQLVSVDFAGRITDPAEPELRQLAVNGRDYLTEMDIVIHDPGEISSDFTFTASSAGDYRPTEHRTELVVFLGVPAGFVLVAATAVVAAAVVLAVRRSGYRRRERP